MTVYNRDDVLAAVDLAELATEMCGPPEGRGPSAKWRCPSPDHPDAHPSMTVYAGQRSQRWKCHSCGEGGTAIDLVMTVQRCGVRDAIEALATRAQLLDRHDDARPPDRRRAARRAPVGVPDGRPAPPDPPEAAAKPAGLPTIESAEQPADPCIESYVAVAAQILWGTHGEVGRDWLHARGFTDEVLCANRVGFDPGPRIFHRDRGLPWRGAGIVYPALAADGTAVYFQTRYLDPVAAGRDKYDNPTSALAINPRVATLRAPDPDPRLGGVVVITEGIPDGLAVAHVGARVGAVIGAANHGRPVASRLHRTFPSGIFIVLFDADHAGRRGGALLGAHLAALDRHVVLSAPPSPHNDINDWWKAEPAALADAVSTGGRAGLYQPDTGGSAVPEHLSRADAPALGRTDRHAPRSTPRTATGAGVAGS